MNSMGHIFLPVNNKTDQNLFIDIKMKCLWLVEVWKFNIL